MAMQMVAADMAPLHSDCLPRSIRWVKIEYQPCHDDRRLPGRSVLARNLSNCRCRRRLARRRSASWAPCSAARSASRGRCSGIVRTASELDFTDRSRSTGRRNGHTLAATTNWMIKLCQFWRNLAASARMAATSPAATTSRKSPKTPGAKRCLVEHGVGHRGTSTVSISMVANQAQDASVPRRNRQALSRRRGDLVHGQWHPVQLVPGALSLLRIDVQQTTAKASLGQQ